MDILILDIGNSYTKATVYGLPSGIRFDKWLRTPPDKSELMGVIHNLLGRVHANGFHLSAIMPISFSDALVCYTENGDVIFTNCDHQAMTMHGESGSYILQQISKQKDDDIAIEKTLPYSAYVAAQLSGAEIKTWDWTHASNIDLNNTLDEKDQKVNPVSPTTIVGTLGTTQTKIMLGGHDTTFMISDIENPYIHCGTWITAGFQSKMIGYEKYRLIRTLLDSKARTHVQLCLNSQSDYHLLLDPFIRNFEDGTTFEVSGVWGKEFIDEIPSNFPPVVLKYVARKEGLNAAIAAQEALYEAGYC